MILTTLKHALGGVSGLLAGFILGLVGGVGSVLAVPLMLYLIGIKDPHQAIGTSAFAVAPNALARQVSHAAAGTVNWRCGVIFAGAGIVGALAGSTLGKAIDGQKLLFLFAMLILFIATLMVRGISSDGVEGAQCNREHIAKLMTYGLGTRLFGVVRDWRRLSDRTRPDYLNLHADPARDRHFASRGDRIWRAASGLRPLSQLGRLGRSGLNG